MNKGQLITWKDEKGFGFIKPDDGSKEIFLHISALPKMSRRPKVGDTILYEQALQENGKIRATNASIAGVISQSSRSKRKSKQRDLLNNFVGAAVGMGAMATIALFATHFSPARAPSVITAIRQPGCFIKGNISIATGDRLYHLPGMEDYEQTVIDPAEGERWFCTELEATQNGWRKAPR